MDAGLLCPNCGLRSKPHLSWEVCVAALRGEIARLQFSRVTVTPNHAPDRNNRSVISKVAGVTSRMGGRRPGAGRKPECFCGKCYNCIARARRRAAVASIRAAAESTIARAPGGV